MCQFCVQHGDGKRWYLNAENYSFDLSSDLRRRDYIVDFVRDFERTRQRSISWMERMALLPSPVSRIGKDAISRRMRKHHFGQPIPLEECRQVLDLSTSITVIPCICRMHEPGKTAEEVCVLVTTQPITDTLENGFRDYADGPSLEDFRTATVDETMTLLRQCEERGLMHSIWTFQTPFTAAICNCNLESGCMAMKLTAGYDMKLMWRGEWVARLDSEKCTRCRKCERVCPFSAIGSEGGRVVAHAERCCGCGICRSACPADALALTDRRSVPQVASLW